MDGMEMSSTEAVCIADEYPLCQISIPQYIAEKVWTDGKELASQDSNVCISPGCTDGSAWLVKSDNATHQRPYFVECKKSGQLCCEKSCIMFNSCGVCAHIVAVATRKKCLETFINWFSKRDSINVTKMAHSGLPKGAGKKIRSRRKFSTKSSMRKVKRSCKMLIVNPIPPDLVSLLSSCTIEVYSHLWLASVRPTFIPIHITTSWSTSICRACAR